MQAPAAEPTISVALGTRNGAAYVLEQVASILDQSRPVNELVVSDDASTDDTLDIIRGAVAAHVLSSGRSLRLRILENAAPLGVTRNFEQAALATTGDLIALCDQDDIWHPDRIATIVREFADPAISLVFSDARLVDGDGKPLGDTLFRALSMTRHERQRLLSGDTYSALLRRNLVTGATVVFRRSLLEFASPFGPSWVHDEWLAALAAAQGGVRMLESQLIDYRQHGRNEIGAGRLSLTQKVGRMTEPRSARNARLLARAGELVNRLSEPKADVSGSVADAARAKLAHETLRSSLSAFRIRRLPAIAGEVVRGGYSRYGRGLADAGRDLLQPAR